MSDEGFDFRRAPERREAKQFEPPPWEREAFEQLQKKRTEPAEEQPVSQPEPVREDEPAPEVPEPKPHPVAPSAASERGSTEQEKPGIDDSQMIEFLAGLAAEDPPAERAYFPVAMGAALFMSALGAVLLMWGVAALVGARRTGAVGTFAGTGLGLFGVGFFAAGVWLAYQALKRRGVL